MPETIIARFNIRFAWWWTWIYMPLTMFGAMVLGIMPDLEIVEKDCQRAIRVQMRLGKRRWWQRW